MTTYQIRGKEFSAPRDWREYLRAVAAGRQGLPLLDLNPNYDNTAEEVLLSNLFDGLKGTGEETRLADAALSLIEEGSDDDLGLVYKAGVYHEAPRLAERVAAIVEHQRAKLDRVGLYAEIISGALQVQPDDAHLRELVKREAGSRNAAFYEMAARAWPEWFGKQIPSIVLEPDGTTEFDWLTFARPAGRPCILDGIAAAGPEYVRALVERIKSLRTDDFKVEMEGLLRTHPVFARALDEERP